MLNHDELARASTFALSFTAQRLVAGQDIHTIKRQRFARQLRDLQVFADHDAGGHLDLDHFGAKPGEALRQFTTNRAAAQHHQTGGRGIAFGKLFPQGVAGHIADILQTRQRRHKGAGTGGNDDGTCGQALRAAFIEFDFNGPGIHNFGVARQHLHAQSGVAFHTVVRCHSRNHRMYARHHFAEAELGLSRAQAIVFRVAHLMGDARRLDQRLAGHTAIVQTITAHLVGFHQGHFGFDRRCNVGGDQTCGATTNHHQIAVKLLWTLPIGVNASALQISQELLGQHGEHAQQCKRKQQARRHNARQAGDLGQLCAGIDIHQRAGEHANLADPVVAEGTNRGQAHQQINQKEWKHRHQAQCEQVQGAIFGDTLIDGLEPVAKTALNGVAQHIPRGQKCECRPQTGGKRNNQCAHRQAKQGACGQRQNGSARQGQRRDRHIDAKKGQSHRYRRGRTLRLKLAQAGF